MNTLRTRHRAGRVTLLATLAMAAGYGATASASTVASLDWTTFSDPGVTFTTTDGQYTTTANAFGGGSSYQQQQDWSSTASASNGGSVALGDASVLRAMTAGGATATADVVRAGDFTLAAGQTATFTVNGSVSTSDNKIGADVNLGIMDLSSFTVVSADDLFLATNGTAGNASRTLSVTITNNTGASNDYYFTAEANVTPVPLPPSAYLMVSGLLAGLTFTRRRGLLRH